MIAKRVEPSTVMLLTRKAPGGTSPWSVPPDATLPVGFQPIGPHGLRIPTSTCKEDLFLSAIAAACPPSLFLGAAAAVCSAGFALGATGAGFSSAAIKIGVAKIDNETSARNLFIVVESPWSQR